MFLQLTTTEAEDGADWDAEVDWLVQLAVWDRTVNAVDLLRSQHFLASLKQTHISQMLVIVSLMGTC